MVEVYGKKARQIHAQHPLHRRAGPSPWTRRTLSMDAQDRLHRRAHAWVNAQCKERGGVKKGRKKPYSPREWIRSHNPHLRRASLYKTFILHKDSWLQLLYEYHQEYILNSIAQYPMHMKERERERPIELNLKVQKTVQYSRV